MNYHSYQENISSDETLLVRGEYLDTDISETQRLEDVPKQLHGVDSVENFLTSPCLLHKGL